MTKRTGFTLIEMLLATVLTAVLMVGVLAVITRVAEPIRADAEGVSRANASELDVCIRVLHDDLSQARTVEASGGGLLLMTYSGLDPDTLERTQLPVYVRYDVREIAGRSWLVREQELLVDRDASDARTEPVMAGVTRIALERIQPSAASPTNSGADDLPIESACRLLIWTGDPDTPVVSQPLMVQRRLLR